MSHYKLFIRCPLFSCLFVLLVSGYVAALTQGPDLLDEAVGRHMASLAAISTLSTKVQLESEIPEGADLPANVRPKNGGRGLPVHRGEYKRSGFKVRIDEIEGPLGPRTVIIDYGNATGQMRVPFGTSGGFSGGIKPIQPAVTEGPAMQTMSHLDISEGYLFTLPRPIPPDYEFGVSLERLISKAKSTSARHEILDGVDTVRLDVALDGQGNGFTIWLDTQANYLFRRIVSVGPASKGLEVRILEFSEVKPGIFCPVLAERKLPKVFHSTLRLSEIHVNDPLSDREFSTLLPQGTRVVNHSEGRVYDVGSNGRPETVVGRIIEPSPKTTSDVDTIAAATPLNADNPTSWTWSHITLAASVIFALFGSVVWYRRRK